MTVKNLLNKSFFTRVISGIALLLIIVATGIIGGDVLFALVTVISVIGLFEIYRVVGIHKSILGICGYIATLTYYGLLRFFDTKYSLVVLIGFILVVLATYVFSFPKFKTEEVTMCVFGFVYVVMLLSFMYLIRMTEDGIYTYWLLFIGSWICDTCAYLTGVTCGKHKMAPILSPKKSIEGAVGGVVGAALIGAAFGTIIGPHLETVSHPEITFALLCGIAGLVSMVGDLSASAIKRNYDVKDYGKLIPGHGGIMDRFDSVIFIAPVVYYILRIAF